MGVEHGAYCLGCCWFLMGLLFVGGIMNLFWILGLTVYVLLEKLLMNQAWNKFSKMMGIGLICFGFHLLLNDFV